MSAVLLDYGWGWRYLNSGRTAHLVPPRPGRLSRTACNRLSLAGAHLEEPVAGLFGARINRCSVCAKGEEAAA